MKKNILIDNILIIHYYLNNDMNIMFNINQKELYKLRYKRLKKYYHNLCLFFINLKNKHNLILNINNIPSNNIPSNNIININNNFDNNNNLNINNNYDNKLININNNYDNKLINIVNIINNNNNYSYYYDLMISDNFDLEQIKEIKVD
jgi:hypothetical protein